MRLWAPTLHVYPYNPEGLSEIQVFWLNVRRRLKDWGTRKHVGAAAVLSVLVIIYGCCDCGCGC